MDAWIALLLAAAGLHLLNRHRQLQRVQLLARELAPYRIEALMEQLMAGYMRALEESEPGRRDAIWSLLGAQEVELSLQFQRFAAAFERLAPAETRVSKLPFALPLADIWLPGATFDMRRMLRVHAQGIADTVQNDAGDSPKSRAYTLSAELLLMQHSCHWYCRSRAVASARLLARHKTSHLQALESVSPGTRAAYRALLGG